MSGGALEHWRRVGEAMGQGAALEVLSGAAEQGPEGLEQESVGGRGGGGWAWYRGKSGDINGGKHKRPAQCCRAGRRDSCKNVRVLRPEAAIGGNA